MKKKETLSLKKPGGETTLSRKEFLKTAAGLTAGLITLKASGSEKSIDPFRQMKRDLGKTGLSVVPLDHCMKHIDIGSKRGDLGDIVLSAGLSIRGRVVDAAGKPLEGL